MKNTYSIMLKKKYLLEYCGMPFHIANEDAVNYTIELVDGFKATTMVSIAVGVNSTHILFKVENYRHNQKDVYWDLLDKNTGKTERLYDRPKGMRFSKINYDFEEVDKTKIELYKTAIWASNQKLVLIKRVQWSCKNEPIFICEINISGKLPSQKRTFMHYELDNFCS